MTKENASTTNKMRTAGRTPHRVVSPCWFKYYSFGRSCPRSRSNNADASLPRPLDRATLLRGEGRPDGREGHRQVSAGSSANCTMTLPMLAPVNRALSARGACSKPWKMSSRQRNKPAAAHS